jgi:hypothetical protein
VIAEHRDHGDRAGAQILRKEFGLLWLAEIGEIPGEHQDICFAGNLAKKVAVGSLRILLNMQIAHGGNLDLAVAVRFASRLPLFSHRGIPLRRRRRRSPIP